jgi:ribosomal protein S18 acetylase RimI-like enzyme
MDVRQATTDDIEGIRTVAYRSLSSSYDFLDESTILSAVANWYNDDALEAALTESSDVVLVGLIDGEVGAFSHSVTLEGAGVGEVQWLHVDPAHRGDGVGAALFDRTEETLRGQGLDRVRGVVVADNEAGANFYRAQGFERVDERPVTVGGVEHTELVFESGAGEAAATAASVERHEFDGLEVYVFHEEGDRGSRGQFLPAYRDRDAADLYAWYCAACGSFDNAMDTMGRVECNECGNVRKPTRWDAAYL